jgi:hypothetical protein
VIRQTWRMRFSASDGVYRGINSFVFIHLPNSKKQIYTLSCLFSIIYLLGHRGGIPLHLRAAVHDTRKFFLP